MDKRAFVLFCGGLLLPAAASAYVGPGAGLSLLGALWALVVALATAIVFVLAWPVRKMLRRKREARERAASEREATGGRDDAAPAADTAAKRVDVPEDIAQSQRQ